MIKCFSFYPKKQHVLKNIQLFSETAFLRNKEIISISPGGFKGFYVLGICKFIKQNYNLEKYVFSGASAGSWNSLLLCFNRDISEIETKILDSTLQNIDKISDIENRIKSKILQHYSSNDFDLRRLFIGVTTIDNCKKNMVIYSDFHNLEDAIDCCIDSSHIPLITGGLTNIYRNVLTFDGGFSKSPYINFSKPVLHIYPSIWSKKKSNPTETLSITDYTTLLSKEKYNFKDLVEKGFYDSLENKKYLDSVFLK